MNKNLKKVYIILEDGVQQFIGFSDSLYQWFQEAEQRLIVPFHGHVDYVLVRNVYNKQYDQYVTYKTV